MSPVVFRSVPGGGVSTLVAAIDQGQSLPAGSKNGQLGLVRHSGDDFEMRMRWNTGAARWHQEDPLNVMGTNDAWAVDGINQQPADFRDWYRPVHGVGWYRTGARAVLATNYSGGSTLTVKTKVGIFANAGQLMVRGFILTYAGQTDNGNGTYTFTGVTGGNGGVTLPADLVPVIPSDSNNVGDLGGWGLTPVPVEYAGELWAAGLRLEERVAEVHLNGSADNYAMDTALYWFQYNLTVDLYANPVPWDPPSGGLGFGNIVTGPALPGRPGDAASNRASERSFEIKGTDWQSWVAGPPTKHVLRPVLYHRMPVPAGDTGEEYGRTHQVRWVWTP